MSRMARRPISTTPPGGSSTCRTTGASKAATSAERQHLPVLSIVEGKWQFHRGDNPEWKKPDLKADGWETVQLPNWWNDHSGYNDEHCFGWYRRTIQIPQDMQGKTILLNLGKIDDCDQTFFNGKKIGATGHMPPHYATAWETTRLYKLDPKLVRAGENVVAVRVYNGESKGGMYDAGATALKCEGPFDPLSPAGDGGGYLDGGIGWYRKTFATPAGSQRPPRLDRVRRRLHGQRRLAQRQAPGPASLRLHELLLRPDRRPEARRGRTSWPCGSTSRNLAAAGTPGRAFSATCGCKLLDPVHVAHWGTYVTTPTVTRRCGRREDRHPRGKSRRRGRRGATLDRDHRARRQGRSRRRRAAQAGHRRRRRNDLRANGLRRPAEALVARLAAVVYAPRRT